jgi:hypothetical protein
MEETLTPDLKLNSNKLTIDSKEYSFYCRRPTKNKAELIKKDLEGSGFEAAIREANGYHKIWWRKK